jgi:signal transduction histidine kinase/CheY-like chemotaxis protein
VTGGAADLPRGRFDRVFPFHLRLDDDLRVVSMGPSIEKVCPTLRLGDRLAEHFEIERPHETATADSLRAADGEVFVLSAHGRRLRLKGQVVAEPFTIDLLATPWVATVSELEALGLSLSDFAIHDPIVDFLLLVHSQQLALDDTRALTERLTSQRAELRAANRRVAAQFAATRALAEAKSLEGAVRAVLESVGPALGAPVAVHFAADGPGRLAVWQRWAADAAASCSIRMVAADDPLAIVIRNGQTAALAGLEAQGSSTAAALVREGLGVVASVPIALDGRSEGVLAFFGRSPAAFDDATEYMLADLGTRMSQLLRRLEDDRQREEHAAQLAAARDAALEASQLKSAFLASVSHELRTPLSGVVGMASLLLDGRLEPEQRELADLLLTSANGLRRIIDDLLDFSKLESGRVALESVPVDVGTLVEEVTAQFGAAAAARGLDLVCSVDPRLTTHVHADPTRLRQVLANLVANAVKFTHEGHVHVRADVVRDGARDGIAFEVSDTGIGVARDAAARLFQPFVQADGTTTRRYGGTGLGLAISRQLVELMGGTIGLVSEEGVGSRFRFLVPVRIVTPWVPPVTPLGGSRVLVVDDRPAVRAAICSAVQAAGGESVALSLAELERWSPRGGDEVVLLGFDPQRPEEVRIAKATLPSWGARAVLLPAGAPRDQASALGVSPGAVSHTPVRPSHIVESVLGALGLSTQDTIPPPSATTPASHARRGRALVAEDDHVNQVITSTYLRKLGFDVDVVEDGHAALEAATRGGFDVLVLDAHMPGLDGLSVARAVRTLPDSRGRVRIVALTAGASADERARCLDAGMDEFVAKPATAEALGAAVIAAKSPPTSKSGSWSARQWPTLDRVRVRDLVTLDASGIAAREVAALFRSTVSERLESMSRALDRGDTTALHREAHATKGAAEAVGATALAQLARRLETAGAAGDVAELGAVLGDARTAFLRAVEALDRELAPRA